MLLAYCENTPDWSNSDQHDCYSWVGGPYCNGTDMPGENNYYKKEKYNNPHENCCWCGGGCN